jgi:Tol biopolymer transport system component
MYRKTASGSGEETLFLRSATHQWSTDWSRDGRFILYTNLDPTTQADVVMASAFGDPKATPVLNSSFNEYAARLSPDGRWTFQPSVRRHRLSC